MARKILAIVLGLLGSAAPAVAQVDPLLFIKDAQPNVLFVVDTSNRMQRDAPGDPANSRATSSYYDPFIYTHNAANAWEATLGISGSNTTTNYRRKYYGLSYAGDNATTSSIRIVTDQNVTVDTAVTPSPAGVATYSLVGAPTRLAIARAAMYQAIKLNQTDVQFGLIRMRQKNPTIGTQGNTDSIGVPAASQSPNTEKGSVSTTWKLTRPDPGSQPNAAGAANATVLVHSTETSSNEKIQVLVGLDVRGTQRGPAVVTGYNPSPLLPAGIETTATAVDAPIKYMLDDAKTEAATLISGDTSCTNTIVVLIVGGGEGTTSSLDPAAAASGFLNVQSGRRVPIYVIAIAPPSSDVTQLQAIAANSGGQYFEITKAEIDAALASPTLDPSAIAGTVVVPQMVNAINTAIQHGLAAFSDVNTAPTASLPHGPATEFPAASPIIGTVNLENAKDITGASLPNTIVNDKAGTKLPQRSNLLVTTGFMLPGFTGSLRGFRQYKPVADSTQLSGWKFSADGTRLWIACVPGQTGCASTDSNKRNLYTATADGSIVAFTTANASTLAPLMNLSVTDATAVIAAVRKLPIGPFVDSTPAIMNPPSLDPPPDDDYPAFAVANKDRRAIIWVGSNYGILEGIDARLGVEVWGFIPLNLLPKLKMLRQGQPITQFMYLMDGSAKVADVKIDDVWRTHLIMGEGAGGTFYQSFDVTMADIASAVAPESDNLDLVLQYFSNPAKIALNWTFPRYSSFDATIAPYGDVSAAATTVEKSVGQTWSDPAVGQVVDSSGPFTVLIGSGFLPYSTQQQTNRAGKVAGTTFYVLKAKDGTVLDSKDVGSDALNETVDDCSANVVSTGDAKKGKKKKQFGCTQIKNALQSDPVATGPADSRFITKAYMGDLDGRVWRFDVGLDASANAKIVATTKLYEAGSDQPVFSSMAAVNVGGSQQYIFFGTGSDLLPSTTIGTSYHLLGVLDKGTTGLKTLDQKLAKTDSRTMDEKVTAFPAVAGDIVFFTTTDFQPATACTAPVANLYAFTFIGGAAYDTTGDGKVSGADTPLVKSITGARATAPYVVDQHLAFAAGNKVALFGDPTAYNNGIGQAGVRILSWREVR
jgi:hypothetical protein